MNAKLIRKSAFQGVGVMWKGTFKQAEEGEIRQVLHQFRQQILNTCRDVQYIYGISVHNILNGFTYYICIEKGTAPTPDEFSSFEFAEGTYATLVYKGKQVDEAYRLLYKWIEDQQYKVADDRIGQFEIYPLSYEPLKDEPDLTIMVPVKIEENGVN